MVMTKEEAIAVLQKIKPIPRRADGKSTTHILETIALDMAINALEQEPCEDAISRQAVLDIWHTSYSNNRAENEEIQYKKIAFELPSVTPQPKTGQWEKVNTAREYNSDAYECSECKYIIWTYKDSDRKWNYCPSCGCRMIESEMEE